MSDFQPITKEEWEAVSTRARHQGRASSPEVKALQTTSPETGWKTPCRWKHSEKHNVCPGSTLMYHASKRYHLTVRTVCRDGTLYIWHQSPSSA